MSKDQAIADPEETGPLETFRQFFALERDVLVVSLSMFAFSLGFQMTSRFLPEYMVALGASGFVVGLFGTFGNVISAVYPYPGGAISDRIGSRYALTAFGLVSTVGFVVWLIAPNVGAVTVAGVTIEPWIWIFVGLVLAQAWKSFGLGATFAVVKQATDPSRLAAGFASTETFRRTALLIGPVLAAILIDLHPAFTVSFRYVLAVAVVFGVVGTLVQHVLYDASGDAVGGGRFEGVPDPDGPPRDARPAPAAADRRHSRPLRERDGVRLLRARRHADLLGGTREDGRGRRDFLRRGPLAAGLFRLPAGRRDGRRADHDGPRGEAGWPSGSGSSRSSRFFFRVRRVPLVLVFGPDLLSPFVSIQWALVLVFAFSGLRFAGLPSHKALIVGPAEQGAGGRVTGTYYLLRNTIVIPSAAIGGYLWDFVSPEVFFTVAAVIGVAGTGYFLVFGEEFEAYARGR